MSDDTERCTFHTNKRQKKNDATANVTASSTSRAISHPLRAYVCVHRVTATLFLSFHLELRFFFLDSLSTEQRWRPNADSRRFLVSDNSFYSASHLDFTIFSHYVGFLLFLSSSSSAFSSSSSSTSSSSSSFFSSSFTIHRSGKDPPRVALHKRVVDEESVELALRQHYPADYRYPGRPVISFRVRSTVWWRPPARRNEN